MKTTMSSKFMIVTALVFFVGTTTVSAVNDQNADKKADRAMKKVEREANREAKKMDREEEKMERKALREQKKIQRAADFCQKVVANSEKLFVRITDGQNRIEKRYAEHKDKITDRKTEKRATITKNRSLQDARRDAHYAQLISRATTDEQKAAVEAYKKDVETSVVTHRESIDSAFDVFWDGVVVKTGDQKSAHIAAYQEFAEQAQTLIDTARTECADADSPKDTAKSLRNELKTLQSQFKERRVYAKNLKKDIIALRTNFHEARNASGKTFRSAVKDARATLKAVFSEVSIETDEVDNAILEGVAEKKVQ